MIFTQVAAAYYGQQDKAMLKRLRAETSGWYNKLLTYLVESPEDADVRAIDEAMDGLGACLLYTSPSPRDEVLSRMPSSA